MKVKIFWLNSEHSFSFKLNNGLFIVKSVNEMSTLLQIGFIVPSVRDVLVVVELFRFGQNAKLNYILLVSAEE